MNKTNQEKCVYCGEEINKNIQPWDYCFPAQHFHVGCALNKQTNQEEFDHKREPGLEKIRQFIYDRPSHTKQADKNWGEALLIIRQTLQTEKEKMKNELVEWAEKNRYNDWGEDGATPEVVISHEDLINKLKTL